MDKYWRITYKGEGIYETLKKQIWNEESLFTKEDWESFKTSNDVTWLKLPNIYKNASSAYRSYFKKLGFELFMSKTYPIILEYLDEKSVIVEEFVFDNDKINIVYEDEHQIVIEENI